ncbi:MAG: nicotinate (nicotinamide) nucleotide adenylyltransferase [Alphaproteobacteria bacterium]
MLLYNRAPLKSAFPAGLFPWRLARGQRIGLLGGSFNPAHQGHVDLSQQAMKRLKLDAVWWLVSPQNPLKTKNNISLATRMEQASLLVARCPYIKVMGVEEKIGSTYSARNLTLLCHLLPYTDFIWLMGADNLAQLHRWRQWPEIFSAVKLAVFARSPYAMKALHAPAARAFAHARCPYSQLMGPAPRWSYITMPENPLSSTYLRQQHKATIFGTKNRGRLP